LRLSKSSVWLMLTQKLPSWNVPRTGGVRHRSGEDGLADATHVGEATAHWDRMLECRSGGDAGNASGLLRTSQDFCLEWPFPFSRLPQLSVIMADATSRAESTLKLLRRLLESGNLTEPRFRQTLAVYPSLLDPAVDPIIRSLASLQSIDDSRRAVEAVADLLSAVRLHGIEAGLVKYRSERVRKERETRLEQTRIATRQHRRDRARARNDRLTIRNDLRSLSKTIEAISDGYPRVDIELISKSCDPEAARSEFSCVWPRFLFRGESSAYATTTSSLSRLRTSLSIPLSGLEDILRVTMGVRLALEEQLRMPRLLAEGFLQHYGYPTDFLDVTADVGVAASFASDLSVGDIGAVCVLQTELLHKNAVLVDLRDHEYAERPRRQHALVITGFGNGNLKHPSTVETLRLKWLPFQFKEEDDARFIPDPELLDGHSDPVAGLAQLMLSEYGKIEDNAARWLADHIQPAPTIGVTAPGDDGDLKVRLLAADEAGAGVYDEARQRQVNYESWSERFPAPEHRDLPPELLTSVGVLQAGSMVHLMRSRAFELQARKKQG